MESGNCFSFLHNRRLEGYFNTNSASDSETGSSNAVMEELLQRPNIDSDVGDDDDGGGFWFSGIVSCIKIVLCFTTMMITTVIWVLIMVALLPWPCERIRQGNVYGHVTGKMLIWILGSPIKIEGVEHSNERAIYISNHASFLDAFLVMWLAPVGAVGIASKEVIWFPLFGQLYVLANHLWIDRSNPSSAIKSMKEAANKVVENKLSLIIFPEGTRSENGRLLPFKKGFVHLALQTRIPIVPMVMTGTHRAWRKGSLHVRAAPITVKYLPPIKTEDWEVEKINEYVEMVHNVYVDALPEDQKPGSSCNGFTGV